MGIGGGMGLYNSPTVVESIMSATLEHAEKVIPAVVQLSNGLGCKRHLAVNQRSDRAA